MADVTQPTEEPGQGPGWPGAPSPEQPGQPGYGPQSQPGYGSQPPPGYQTAQAPPPAYPGYPLGGQLPGYPLGGQQPYAPPAGYGAYQPYPGSGYLYQPGTDPTLAPYSHRLLARIIDWFVAGTIGSVPAIPLWVSWFHEFTVAFRNNTQPPSDLGLFALTTVIFCGIYFLYDWIQHAVWGQTLGKRALGTIVVTADSRSKISAGAAAARAAVFTLPPIILYLGGFFDLLDGLWLLWDQRRQCLHDKAARTVVVRKASLGYPAPPTGYAGAAYPGYPGSPPG